MKPKSVEFNSEDEVAKLAESGDPVALEILALATELGFSNTSSPEEAPKRALELWQKASDKGSHRASFQLGYILDSGTAGTIDKKLSGILFKRAEKGGFLTEHDALARLEANKKSSAKLGGHVLLIDSHEQDVQMLDALLKAHGCYLSHVKNGSLGLQFLAQNSDVKLVFTELNLQLMGGLEFLKRMRSSDYRNIPVVVYSSEASKENIIEVKKQQVLGWLMKPVSKEKLNEIMKIVPKGQKIIGR
jgi:CheY-like chemotaxis protein